MDYNKSKLKLSENCYYFGHIANTHTHTHTHTHTQIYIYIYIYIFTHTHIITHYMSLHFSEDDSRVRSES